MGLVKHEPMRPAGARAHGLKIGMSWAKKSGRSIKGIPEG